MLCVVSFFLPQLFRFVLPFPMYLCYPPGKGGNDCLRLKFRNGQSNLDQGVSRFARIESLTYKRKDQYSLSWYPRYAVRGTSFTVQVLLDVQINTGREKTTLAVDFLPGFTI